MWLLLIGLAILLTLIYCVLILFYHTWFKRLQYFKPNEALKPQTRFSIVIPARNEEASIEKCVRSIECNDYSKNLYEIIVVDDFSDDATSSVVKKMQQQFSNLNLLELKNFVDIKL